MTKPLLMNPTALDAALEASFTSRSTVTEKQIAAFDRFAKLRFPNRRVEGWKWSDFNGALRGFAPANDGAHATTIAPSPFAALAPLEIRIVDGRIELPPGDLPEGVRYGIMDTVGTIAELENHSMAALNVAMTRKAFGLEVMEGVDFKQPIIVRHINTGRAFSFAQTMMRFAPNARAHLIETYEGDGAGFYSHLCHLAVRDGATVTRTVLNEASAQQILNAICAVKVDGDATFNQTSFSTGGKLVRHESHVHFWAPNSSANINSAALLSDDRHCDFTSETVHFANPVFSVFQVWGHLFRPDLCICRVHRSLLQIFPDRCTYQLRPARPVYMVHQNSGDSACHLS